MNVGETFLFRGQELAYFEHRYNRTGLNMRAVEVPIARAFLRDHEEDRILELGNVLSHYGSIHWPVLDAKEQGPDVVTADVMRWQPDMPLDRIVSISTLEHVGHEQYAHLTTPNATPAGALARIRSWLAPGGVALLTVPAGYNAVLDRQLVEGDMPADEIHCMQRVSEATAGAALRNEWAECSLAEALAAERPAGYRWSVGMVALFCAEEGELRTLNLGAGRKPMKGAVNHDRRLDPDRPEITIGHDLNLLPWPWEDESFDRIVSRAVFEHLDIDLVASLDECWRLLRPGGILYLKLPYWKSDISYQDPTHRWFFSVRAFDQFDPDRRRGREYGFYTDRHWKIIKGPKLNDARSSIHLTLEVRK